MTIEGPTIETLDRTTVVGIHRVLGFEEPAMREVWQAFRPRTTEIRHRPSDDFISMRIYETPVDGAPAPGSRFDYWAAVEVRELGEIPSGMDAHTLEGGPYAVFTYKGPAAGFASAAHHIYGTWLPNSEYELADREFLEVLGPSYRPDDPEASERVWIPVRDG